MIGIPYVRADQLTVNPVLNPTNATGLPGLKLRQVATTLNLSSLLLGRLLWAWERVRIEFAKDAAIEPFHSTCAALIDEIPCYQAAT